MNDLTLIGFYKEILETAGYTVDVAVGGEVGLSKISNSIYDLVLLQFVLTEIQATDVLRRFYKSGKPQGKIVIFDNLMTKETIEEAFSLGVDGYELMCDVTPSELLNLVNSYIDGSISKEQSRKLSEAKVISSLSK